MFAGFDVIMCYNGLNAKAEERTFVFVLVNNIPLSKNLEKRKNCMFHLENCYWYTLLAQLVNQSSNDQCNLKASICVK